QLDHLAGDLPPVVPQHVRRQNVLELDKAILAEELDLLGPERVRGVERRGDLRFGSGSGGHKNSPGLAGSGSVAFRRVTRPTAHIARTIFFKSTPAVSAANSYFGD